MGGVAQQLLDLQFLHHLAQTVLRLSDSTSDIGQRAVLEDDGRTFDQLASERVAAAA